MAARDFTLGRRTWRQGDEIPHGATLRHLLRFGDKFAVSTKTSTTPVEHPAEPPRGEASKSPERT